MRRSGLTRPASGQTLGAKRPLSGRLTPRVSSLLRQRAVRDCR
jgi:hypothetical protein